MFQWIISTEHHHICSFYVNLPEASWIFHQKSLVWFPSCLVLVQADESVGFGGLRLNPGSQDPITVTDTTTVRIVPDTTEHYRALYVENTELWRMARGLTHPSSISPEIRWWNMTCARLGGEPLVWEEEEEEEERRRKRGRRREEIVKVRFTFIYYKKL